MELIKNIKFEHKGKISVCLSDGRIIIVPLSYFPTIKKLSSIQRKKWQILDGVGFTFEDTDELFHLSRVFNGVNAPCC